MRCRSARVVVEASSTRRQMGGFAPASMTLIRWMVATSSPRVATGSCTSEPAGGRRRDLAVVTGAGPLAPGASGAGSRCVRDRTNRR